MTDIKPKGLALRYVASGYASEAVVLSGTLTLYNFKLCYSSHLIYIIIVPVHYDSRPSSAKLMFFYNPVVI